jgi:hypothetical protein
MAFSFSGGRRRSAWREPPTMGKQLVNFITCGCESSAPFLQFTKPTFDIFLDTFFNVKRIYIDSNTAILLL